jgi:hypothetical protein
MTVAELEKLKMDTSTVDGANSKLISESITEDDFEKALEDLGTEMEIVGFGGGDTAQGPRRDIGPRGVVTK